ANWYARTRMQDQLNSNSAPPPIRPNLIETKTVIGCRCQGAMSGLKRRGESQPFPGRPIARAIGPQGDVIKVPADDQLKSRTLGKVRFAARSHLTNGRLRKLDRTSGVKALCFQNPQCRG